MAPELYVQRDQQAGADVAVLLLCLAGTVLSWCLGVGVSYAEPLEHGRECSVGGLVPRR